MYFHIVHTKTFWRTASFRIQGVPINNLAPIKKWPLGMQGNLNWMPGYMYAQQTEVDQASELKFHDP